MLEFLKLGKILTWIVQEKHMKTVGRVLFSCGLPLHMETQADCRTQRSGAALQRCRPTSSLSLNQEWGNKKRLATCMFLYVIRCR
jgi:hypothetical protein